MIKVGSKQIKNLPSELTIDEFEAMSRVLNNDKLLEIDKYREVFKLQGADADEVDELTFEEFGKLVNAFNAIGEVDKGLTQSFEIKGFTYKSYKGETFSLMAKDMAICERVVKQNPDKHLAEIIAVLFKRDDLTKAEHYDTAHINYKAELIREAEIKADVALPFIVIVTHQLGEATKSALLKRADELTTG